MGMVFPSIFQWNMTFLPTSEVRGTSRIRLPWRTLYSIDVNIRLDSLQSHSLKVLAFSLETCRLVNRFLFPKEFAREALSYPSDFVHQCDPRAVLRRRQSASRSCNLDPPTVKIHRRSLLQNPRMDAIVEKQGYGTIVHSE